MPVHIIRRKPVTPPAPDRFRCPKCRGLSWLEMHGEDIVQRCLCGLFKYLQREIDGLTVMSTAEPADGIRLPAVGTKIYKCLLAVAGQHPRPVTTLTVAQVAGLQNKETAALMVMLRIRSLLEQVEQRRGIAGGSTWVLTSTAAEQLKVQVNNGSGD